MLLWSKDTYNKGVGMKVFIVCAGMLLTLGVSAQVLQSNVMSEAYWTFWNPEVQKKIDADIEANRKADAVFKVPGMKGGTDVKVEQLTHDFVFGAHIFNFDQLGNDELNSKYKDLFGTFLNGATIAFYWKTFEMEEGKPRFKGEYRDTAEFWNKCPNPKEQPHWRRPATDPVVEFCESKGIRMHGHVLCWGSFKWQVPTWLVQQGAKEMPFLKEFTPTTPLQTGCLPEPFLKQMKEHTAEEWAELAPNYARLLRDKQAERIVDIAKHYGARLPSWDVANESGSDYKWGLLPRDTAFCLSHYGPREGDYAYRAFQTAQRAFPSSVQLNINDYLNEEAYVKQTLEMIDRGCKIDIVGTQKHFFNPQACLDMAAGKPIETPEKVWKEFELLARTGRPLHRSEVTITAPNNDARGQAIQAIISYNLYRLWFSIKPTMGITWWNLVDDCGAPGEPAISGMFSRQMEPKPVYHVLNHLINTEWKTQLKLKTDAQGSIAFRGFRGKYRATWVDGQCITHTQEFNVR